MKYILPFLLAIATLGTFVFYTNKTEETQQLVNERAFFKKYRKSQHKGGKKLQATIDEEVPEIISYGINLNIDIAQKQRDELSKIMEQNQKLTAQCDVQTIYDDQNDEFDIAVSYSHVNRYDQEPITQQEEMTESQDGEAWSIFQKDVEIEEVDKVTNYFYLVNVNASSGKVNKLQIESGIEEDPFLTYATQQLINDIFPELRKGSYEKAAIEEDNMGTVAVDYTKEDIDAETVAITKEYNTKDYQKLEIPALEDFDSELERVTILNKESGIVEEGATEYDFKLGDINNNGEENLTQGLGAAPEDDFELLGKVDGGLKSNFWLIEKSNNDDLIAKEMFRYRNEAEFEPKRLAFEQKAEIVLGDGTFEEPFELIDFDQEQEVVEIDDDMFYGDDQPTAFFTYEHTKPLSEFKEEEEKLQYQQAIFQEQKELAGASILGKRITVDFVYTGYTDTSNLKVVGKVGGTPIATFVSYSFNNCKESSSAVREEKFITFFQATFPILGIVVIPVKAGGKFAYGYTQNVQVAPRFCQLNVQPYFQASIYGEGSISLAGLISAGIYAQGNFLDTSLHFQATSAFGKSSASLTGNFKAIGFEMGATYTKISCSLKNIRTLQAVEEEDIVEEQNVNRRSLGFRKKFKKIAKPIKKVVHAVKPVVKAVAKVAKTAYNIATSLHKICSTSKGSVKIANYHSSPKQFTLFNKSINFGI